MPQFQPQRLSCTEADARRTRRAPPVRALVRALAVAGVVSHLGLAGLPSAVAQALPSGMNVVHGQATAVVNGSQMTVTNSANAVLNWQAFSVGAGNQVRFEQPGAASRVLNRVVGKDPSQIFGSISSNGQVWLLNPHGVLFGRDARVDVGSLVVSTLGMPLADWVSGRGTLSLTTMGAPGAAPVVNQGELRAASGGRVWLVGGDGGVRNEGVITAPDGQVVLAAGRSVDLVDERLPHVAVRVSAPGTEVVNLGSVAAGGGRVDLLSAVVNQSGIVQAGSMGSAGGVVRLEATESLQLGAGSITSASGSAGGSVLMDAGPAGTLLAAGSVQAIGSTGLGGEVQMLGRHVGLTGGAEVDASGATGGGRVFVGGGLQGQDASLRNAEAVYFGPGATVRADATDNGDGGRIILWSDLSTRAFGTLSARGGAVGGDGGFIETSGGWLDARPASVRTDAPVGLAGQWLLDPYNISIVSGITDTGVGSGPVFTPSGNDAELSVATIISALQTSNVTITTGTAGDGGLQVGDISMNGVSLAIGALPAARSLTLNATRDINLTSAVISSADDELFTVNFNAGRDINFIASDITASNSALAVNFLAGGNINFYASEIFTDFGSVVLAFTAGANIRMDGTDGGTNIYASDGPLQLNFSAQDDIDIIQANISTDSDAATVSLSAIVGSINIDDFSLINSFNGPLVMSADAGLDINIATSSLIKSINGSADVTFNAGGAIRIEGNADILASNGALTSTMTAGGDIVIHDSDIYSFDALAIYLSAGGNVDILNAFFYNIDPTAVTIDIQAVGRIDVVNSSFYSIDSPLTVNLTANGSIDVSGSYFYSIGGIHDLTFDAGVDINIYLSYIDSYASYGGPLPMSVTMNAGQDVAIDNGYIGWDTEPPLNLRIDAGRDIFFGESEILGAGNPSSASLTAGGSINFISSQTSLYLTGDSGVILNSPAISVTGLGLDIDTDGPIEVYTDNFSNAGSTYLWSRAGATAVTLAGSSSPNITSLTDTGLLDLCACTAGARWLVYLNDDSGTVPSLGEDFLQYGASYPAAPIPATGNGLLFATQGVLTVSNDSLITKVYDGTAGVTTVAPALQLTGLRGYTIIAGGDLGDVVIGDYVTANVGNDIAIGASGLAVPTIETQAYGGVPVYGFTVAYDLRGDITERPLTLAGVTVANKVYDGSASAQVSGGSLVNLVAGETLNLTLLSGFFSTPDVGAGKSVTGTVALADGSGLASNYLLSSGAFNGTADITARPLTLTGVLAADKVYDGNRDTTLSGGSLGNLIGGQTLGLSFSSGLFDTVNAGTGKLVTGTASLVNGTGLASNYVLPSGGAIGTTAAITQRPLTLSGVVAVDKVYDGTRAAELSGGSLANLVAGETLGIAVPDSLFDTADAGNGKQVTGTAVLVNGTGLASNYQLSTGAAINTTAAITPRPLALSGVVAVDKVYDGTRVAEVSGGSLTNLVAGETLGIGVPDSLFDTADAGNGKQVTGTAVLVNGTGLASNYQLNSGAAINTTAAITPRPLTLSGVVAADKVYDGNRDANVSGGSLGNLVAGQTLGLDLGVGLFDTANAGLDKMVSGTATLSNGTGLASNYLLTGSGAYNTTADVTPRLLTLGSVLAADKVYDGSRDATLSGGSLDNLVAGETLGLALINGLFDTASVGAGKAVTGTATLVDGSGLASNYTLGSAGAVATTASITQRMLTINGVLAADKVYDGTRDTTMSGGSLANLVTGETLGLVLSGGLFDTANAGVGKLVTGAATLSDGTGQAANYTLANNGVASATADIAPRSLTVSGVQAANKTYDGTRDATLSGGSLGNLVAGESLGLALASGLFDNAHVGVGKPVTGTATLVDGSGLAANYTLDNAGAVAAAASITPRQLTLSGVLATDKAYDGTRDTALSGGNLNNLVAGETLALSYSTGLFDTADVGIGKPVSGTASLGDGTGRASDYLLSAGGTLMTSASISPRTLTLGGVAAADKVYDGTRVAALSGGQLANLVSGESLGVVLANGLFDTANVGLDKAVTGTARLVDGSGKASNYQLSNSGVATTADVSPAALQYVADPVTAVQGRLPSVLTGEVTGFVAGETVATATTGTLGFAPTATAQSLPGIFAINGFGLVAMNYTLEQAIGNASAMTIVPPAPPETSNELAVIADTLRPGPLWALAPPSRDVSTKRTLDALQGMRIDSRGGYSFGSIDVDAYSRDALAVLLESRSAYKRTLFDAAAKRLEANPALADLPPCQSEDEVDTGRCLVTDGLIAQSGAGPTPGTSTAPLAGLSPPPPAPTPAAAPPAAAPAPGPGPSVAAAPPVAPVPIAPSPAAAPAAVPSAPAAPIVVATVRPKTVAMAKAPPIPAPRSVRSAALPQIQRKLAVLIGLDNYVDDRIPLLENAGRDVEAMARVLETQLGYQTVVVRDASREAIVGVLNRLALSARPNDSVVVYYAGHGTVVDSTGLGYWIPASADAERPESWISNNDIGKLVGSIRASQVVLISDSCFSGSLVSDRRVQTFSGASDPSALLQRRAAVVMSSGGNEPVADGARNGHSPFASSLMQSLSQLDSWRPGNAVYAQIRQDVTRRLPQTPQYGAAVQGRHAEGADYVFEQRQLEQAPQR